MSVEIGSGLSPKKRNELVEKTVRFLEEHREELYGTEEVQLNPVLKGLMALGQKGKRAIS